MRIQGVPEGLLKTISTEPWRPKMYNTNHGWHLLTAQVIAANNLHREHCHHNSLWRQVHRLCLDRFSMPPRRTENPFRTEPGFPRCCLASWHRFYGDFKAENRRERLWWHTERSFELKAGIGAILKTTSTIMLNGGDSGCTFFYPQLCLSWKSHTCRIVAVTLSQNSEPKWHWRWQNLHVRLLFFSTETICQI